METIQLSKRDNFASVPPAIPADRILEPFDFQADVASAKLDIGGTEYNPFQFFQLASLALAQTTDEFDRQELMLTSAQMARGLYMGHEHKLLVQEGRELSEAASAVRVEHDELPVDPFFRPGEDGDTGFVKRLIADTAVKAVRFSDENYLALVQEHCFELGGGRDNATMEYRAGLAEFLWPCNARIRQKRVNDILRANDPFLYVRASVRDKISIRHLGGSAYPVEKIRHMVANGKAVVGCDPSRDMDAQGKNLTADLTLAPWQKSLLGTPGAKRSNFAAAELCYTLDTDAWAEIAAQLKRADKRTATELEAYLRGDLKSDDARAYMHLRRQIEGPSRLRWLILAQQRNGAVHKEPQINRQTPSGIPTSFWTAGEGWQHTRVASFHPRR